jgi:hypothetical protein
MTIVRLSYSHYNDSIAFSSGEHTNRDFNKSHLFKLPLCAFSQTGLPIILCDAANFIIRNHHYMRRAISGNIGRRRAQLGTHLRCTSFGSPTSCIRSASSSNDFFSSSGILSIIFFDALVRSPNHPGVFVSAWSRPNIDAISSKNFSFCVDHSTSVRRNLDPGFAW